MKKIYIAIILLIVGTGLSFGAKAKPKKTPSAEEILREAREAFFNYEFEDAADLYEEYQNLKRKAKQPVDEEIEIWEKELDVASNAFERVQKIIIVDSIRASQKDFVSSYKLGKATGDIGKASSLMRDSGIESDEIGFISENKDLIIYPQTNGEGDLRLFEKKLLLDGTWMEEEILTGDFEKTGDYAFPFMNADGQTIYFANNGEGSMGGYDIFVAQKDPISGEYRQPLNLGMPFNSPYDDLMFVIDEENGIGWWATNRNSEEDDIIIYVFLYEEVRRNYPYDTENLGDLAKITAYKDTWFGNNGEPITPSMPKINTKAAKEEISSKDFDLQLGNGKTYTRFSDFKNVKAVEMMKQYLNKKKELESKEKTLRTLRSNYKASKTGNDKILQLEEDVEELRGVVNSMKSEVLRLEKSIK